MTLHVSQIYITDQDEPLPPPFVVTTQRVRQQFANALYQLYTHDTLWDFIKKHFDRDVVDAFDTLKPYAFKADLGRYCLLYILGGWYFDVALNITGKIDIKDDIEAVVFLDFDFGLPYGWGVNNALIYMTARHPILKQSIELIVENCRKRLYQTTPFSVSGPELFGRALAREGENSNILYGDRIPLTPLHKRKNFAFVLPDGQIIAFGKDKGNGGDLTPYGATGTNNYMTMWAARDVYRDA